MSANPERGFDFEDPYGHAQEWQEEMGEDEREARRARRMAALRNLPPECTTDPGEFEEEKEDYWSPRGPDKKEE